MSYGHISRSRLRYPSSNRRAALYSRSAYGNRLRQLPPHLMPGVTGRGRKRSRRVPLLLGAVAFVGLSLLLFVGITSVAGGAVATKMTVDQYHDLQNTLPPAKNIFSESFQTTRIYDRNNNLLQEVDDPNGYWRTFVPYEQISPNLINATISAEDATFWTNQGVEPIAIARGAFIIFSGAGSSGGSTITQQLVRALYPTQIGDQYAISRKVREAIAAYQLDQSYSKTDIITMYLNQIFYGQRSYGAEAASQMYFQKHASELDLAEASLLAGVPQLPTTYNPYVNFDLAKKRQSYVLDQMVKLGYITRDQANQAFAETLTIHGDRSGKVRDDPHFTQYVRDYITEHYGEDALYRGGLQVYTTIDSQLQHDAEKIVADRVAEVAPYNVTNGAAVIEQPETGEILAMVGSANFDDPSIDGQINITTSPQQPGSTMKPIVYSAAFEQMHWNPGTTLLDAPFSRVTNDPNNPYQPKNFTGNFYGAVTIRTALSNSLNIPALKAAENVGPAGVIEMGQRLGMKTSFDQTADYYGLPVALGGAEVKLTELVNAYATISNEGKYVPITPITKITDSQGNVLFQLNTKNPLDSAPQVLRAEYAYQIIDILSDNKARHLLFGEGNTWELTQQALNRQLATKSGTTNDDRDSLAMGFTTAAVVGVWTGNTDNSVMQPAPGTMGSPAIFSDLMKLVHNDSRYTSLIQDGNGQAYPTNFPRPSGVYDGQVCNGDAHSPGNGSSTRTELLARGNEPTLLCNQMSDWEQRDLNEVMPELNDPRLVSGAADSIRRYANEMTGGAMGGSPPIQSTASSPPNSQPTTSQPVNQDSGQQGSGQPASDPGGNQTINQTNPNPQPSDIPSASPSDNLPPAVGRRTGQQRAA